MILDIKDAETGEELDSQYGVLIENVDDCDDSCESAGSDSCECDADSSIFDVAGQFSRVFQNSNFGKLSPSSAWILYDKMQFWIIIGLSIAFGLGSLYLVKKQP